MKRVRVSQYAVEYRLHVYPLLPPLVPQTPVAKFTVRREDKRNTVFLRGAEGGVSGVVPDFVNVNEVKSGYVVVEEISQLSRVACPEQGRESGVETMGGNAVEQG